ncbi:MAG TPA: BT4734/BF3469 family protein [Prevotella sp.]|nr:BT4734/BF3469 family protein [Prevotella sp.]
MLDYDKVAVINLDEKVEKASKSKISMVVYRTISGNGLRILLRYKRPAGCTLTATDLHRLAINKAMAYFNWNAEPLDITPKDVTRFYNTILKPEEEKRQEMEKNIRESKATRNKNSGRSNASHTKDAPPTTEEITEYVKKLAEKWDIQFESGSLLFESNGISDFVWLLGIKAHYDIMRTLILKSIFYIKCAIINTRHNRCFIKVFHIVAF